MRYEATNFDAANGLIRYASPGIGGGLSWRTADGTETLDTIGVSDAYVPRWVIYRENLAGLKIPVGTTINGTRTAAGIVVLNKDGSDPAEYYFIKTFNPAGKAVFINTENVKQKEQWNNSTKKWEKVANSWEVISDAYPFFTDVYIDKVRDSSSKIPANYELTGEVVTTKTRSGDYTSMKDGSYLRTTVGGNEVYVPMDALRRKGGNRGGASSDIIATTSFPGGPADIPKATQNDVPIHELNSKGKMVIGAIVLFVGTFAIVKLLK